VPSFSRVCSTAEWWRWQLCRPSLESAVLQVGGGGNCAILLWSLQYCRVVVATAPSFSRVCSTAECWRQLCSPSPESAVLQVGGGGNCAVCRVAVVATVLSFSGVCSTALYLRAVLCCWCDSQQVVACNHSTYAAHFLP
jgi:hypothetical protein